MDELIADFIGETKEGLEALDNDIVQLEQTPDDQALLGNIFRIMHTIKGTCGFLGLGRLESVAHAGENILDKIRDGALEVTPEVISLVLKCIDTIKAITDHIDEHEEEPEGDDTELINKLNACAEGGGAGEAVAAEPESSADVESMQAQADTAAAEEQLAEGEEAGGEDSDDLQALFDAAPGSDSGAVESAETEETEVVDEIPEDSDELQALFDAAPGPGEQVEENSAETKTQEQEGGEDSDDLQALFDAAPGPDSVANAAAAPVEQPQEAVKEEAPKPVEAKAEESKVESKEEKKKEDTVKKEKKAPVQNVRVGLDVLESLMQQASELVLTRNQLLQLIRAKEDSEFVVPLQRLNYITTELQEGVMKTRMQPIGGAWAPLPRIIRDLSVELEKKINLHMIGEETELDRQLLESIKDPLTHMIRNSADHGIESPADRVAVGKPEEGNIWLEATHEGGYIVIKIRDDGKGIKLDIIRNKVISQGLATEAELDRMGDHQILQYIFKAGFSTAEKITSVSGRGVGMDVVRSNIEKIGGTVELDSVEGKGTTFSIKIPLTLAIMSILVVGGCGQRFAVPQISIIEVVRMGKDTGYAIETINDTPLLRLRGQLLPLIYLRDVLELDEAKEPEGGSKFVVVCEVAGRHFGLIVDAVYDTEEIVVKPVSPILSHLDVYSGSTLLGDGSVIFVLDLNGLVRTIDSFFETPKTEFSEEEESKVAKSQREASFVLFRAGDNTPKLIPLDLVARLEEIDISKAEQSRGETVVQYRDNLMYLVALEGDQLPEGGLCELLVFIRGADVMGLVVGCIEDIVRIELKDELRGMKNGFLGSVVYDGKTCDVIDTTYYLNKTFGDIASSAGVRAVENRRILLVDDSPFFRKFVPPELRQVGYEVDTTASAEDAIKILEAGVRFDVIVTDMNMPGMDGKQFVSVCKQSEWSDIPMVALSSYKKDEIDSEEKIEGLAAYVSKASHADLPAILQQVLDGN